MSITQYYGRITVIPREGKYIFQHTCPGDDFEKILIWIPGYFYCLFIYLVCILSLVTNCLVVKTLAPSKISL